MPANTNVLLPDLSDDQRMAFERWYVEAYGDTRDDLRCVLSAGSDLADRLTLIASALAVVENQMPGNADEHQRILRSATQLLQDDANMLRIAFDYLWGLALAL